MHTLRGREKSVSREGDLKNVTNLYKNYKFPWTRNQFKCSPHIVSYYTLINIFNINLVVGTSLYYQVSIQVCIIIPHWICMHYHAIVANKQSLLHTKDSRKFLRKSILSCTRENHFLKASQGIGSLTFTTIQKVKTPYK